MPLTKKQQEYLHNCNHRWNVKTGATGSGKSYLDYTLTIPLRIKASKGEGLIVLLGNTRGTLERNILTPMREVWSPQLVGEIKSDNTVMLFGKKCYALGAENKKHVSKIQGATFEYVYGDEVTTWNAEVFDMLKSRLRSPHCHFDGTCNPASPNHWFKKFLDSDSDIYQQSYNIYDGCLDPKVIEALKKDYAGTVSYARFIEGKWALAEGVVYDMFKPEIHVLDEVPPTEGEYYITCDYGIQNATVYLLWRKEKGKNRWICLDEYYYSGRENVRQKTVTELVDDFERFLPRQYDKYGDEYVVEPERVFVDPSATALIVELRKRGHTVGKAKNDVKQGIQNVQTMLSWERLAFTKKCEKTIMEFGIYCWNTSAIDNGKEEPLKENDHCMDAVRYFVNSMYLVRRE